MPATDAQDVFASARESGAVTPHDDTALEYDALWIGAAGDVAIKHTTDGSAVTYAGAAGGIILPVKGVRVMSTNTTASSIVWMRW